MYYSVIYRSQVNRRTTFHWGSQGGQRDTHKTTFFLKKPSTTLEQNHTAFIPMSDKKSIQERKVGNGDIYNFLHFFLFHTSLPISRSMGRGGGGVGWGARRNISAVCNVVRQISRSCRPTKYRYRFGSDPF